jgi:hypothetical protein
MWVTIAIKCSLFAARLKLFLFSSERTSRYTQFKNEGSNERRFPSLELTLILRDIKVQFSAKVDFIFAVLCGADSVLKYEASVLQNLTRQKHFLPLSWGVAYMSGM